MGGDTHARGAILVDPPIDWAQVSCPANWLNLPNTEGGRGALLRVLETEERTADGLLIRRTLDAIVPASLIAYDLLENVQEIVDRFGEGRTFTGHLDCTYARGEDVWRIAVRDGRAVELRPTWPDEQDRYVIATAADGQAILLGPDGNVCVTADSAGLAEPDWQRLYRRIPAAGEEIA